MIGGNGFILRACPVNDHDLRQSPGPIEEQRFVALAIGETKFAIFEQHRRPFVLDQEVQLASPWRFDIGITCLFAFPPTRKTGKEGLYTGISRMSMEFLGGVPTHEMLGFQPDALMSYCSPEGGKRLAIEPTTFPR